MPRATNSPASRQRRKRTLKAAKGYRGFRSTHFRYAKDAVRKAMIYAFRDRKKRKSLFRRLWIVRINAACRPLGLSYSRLIEGLQVANIIMDRKVLASLAYDDIGAFNAIALKAKEALQKKGSPLPKA
jgi:large subunit ribosomal protein L20